MLRPLRASAWCLAVLLAATAHSQESSGGTIEEIVVTAQKRESSLQDTAVAISAFDQAALERQNIDDMLDVQFAVPNLSFTKTNFSASNLAIRGIGRSVVATSGDSGVGIHFNGAYLQQSSIFESEFFDVERVEVLRGPQGTLYGRNTTGGVVNILPAKADEEFGFSFDGQLGNYETRRGNAMVNIPVTDTLQVRLSGMLLDRDGYTDNDFTGNEIDDRDLWSTRIAVRFAPTDRLEMNFFWQHFEEDSSRMRTNKQYCDTDTAGLGLGAEGFPFNLGCNPNADIDSPGLANSQASLGGILASLPVFPTGASLYPIGTNAFANSVIDDDPRTVFADFDPTYEFDEDIVNLEITYDFDNYTLTLNGSYQESEYFAQTDYDWGVASETFTPNLLGGALTDENGVLLTPADPTVSGYNRLFAYDTSAFEGDTWTGEVRLQSDWIESPWDFLIGGFYLDHETDQGYYDVHANSLAILAPAEFDSTGAPLAYFRSNTEPYTLETWAIFGELYFDVTERMRLTGGLRYSDEKKEVSDRQSLLNNPTLPFVEGITGRSYLNDAVAFPVTAALGITDRTFHGFGSSGGGQNPNNAVPGFRNFDEDWQEWTGKFGVEYDADLAWFDESLLFATYARSYKSGGINPPSFTGAFQETFEPEFIDSIELGAKTRMFDNTLQANLTWFFYDYDDLQVTKIVDRTSVNENIDAEIMGLEAEFIWVPTDALRVNAFFSWLDTDIQSGTSTDPNNPTAGDPNWVVVKNSGADIFLAPVGTTFDEADCSGGTLECATIFESSPVDAAGNALPVLPNTLLVPTGIQTDLSGNQLPNAPEFSVSIGVEYSFRLPRNLELVPRVDYYWQDDFYYRVYNTNQDNIESWDVWNASLTLFGGDGSWYAEGFIKNIADDEFITGGYFTDYSSANFTNTFILEPRTYGLTVGYRM